MKHYDVKAGQLLRGHKNTKTLTDDKKNRILDVTSDFNIYSSAWLISEQFFSAVQIMAFYLVVDLPFYIVVKEF